MMSCSQPRLLKYRRLWASSAIAFMLLASSTVAFAHGAVLWAYVENDHVYVEAFFMGGKKVKEGRIVVVDATGKKLLEGKTDGEGKFDFAPPVHGDMTILLLLDQAHGSEFKIKKQDFEASENVTPESTVPATPEEK